ncbi:UNVERIFIED_ORG: uncharacterized protein DUF2325 [Anoxybacillus amylolyticus]
MSMDIRPFMDQLLHVTVWLKGSCPACRRMEKKQIFDYGVLPFRELDQKMEDQFHEIRSLVCSRCQNEFPPETLVYYEEIRKQVITEAVITYGSEMEGEQALAMEEGHRNRHKIFQEQESRFWEEYNAYACSKWKELLHELNDFEFRDAYQALNIPVSFKSVAQYRKDAMTRFSETSERMKFWQAANHYFVYEHVLGGGFFGFDAERTAKAFGRQRTRFVVLHLPMDESLELLRTMWIGGLVKKEKEDHAFLFRRISILTDELTRLRQKNLSLVKRMEEMKGDLRKLEERLAAAHKTIEQERQRKMEYRRHPDDVQKIREMKQWISELIQEIKMLRSQNEEESLQEEAVLDETPIKTQEIANDEEVLEILRGKTVGIIGGDRKEEKKGLYPCQVLFHHGRTRDPAFERVLKESDLLIVLTQFVSHLTMWEVKAYALEEEKPIYFLKGLNVHKLLTETAKLEKRKSCLRQSK